MCDCAPGTQVLAKPSTSCGSYEGRPLSSAMGDHILRILDYKVCLAQVNDRLNHKGAKVKLPINLIPISIIAINVMLEPNSIITF